MSGVQGEPTSGKQSQSNKNAVDYSAVDASGRPLFTAMRTPIIYGKSYLNKTTGPISKEKVIDTRDNFVSTDYTPVINTNTQPSIYTKKIVSDIPDETEVKVGDIPLIPAGDILETIPSIYVKDIVSSIPKDTEVKATDIPLIPAGDILETVPTIYTNPIVTGIPNDGDIKQQDIPLIIPEIPLEIPNIPEVPKEDKSFFDDPSIIDVGPSRGLRTNQEELPEEFDKYLSSNNPMTPDFSSYGGGISGGKYFDDQSMATMAFVNGTTSVKGYAMGTTKIDEDDPWNWVTKEQVAPLASVIKPSEAVIPQGVPDETEKYLSNQAMALGTNAATKGINAAYNAYSAPLTTKAVSSMGTNALTGAQIALPNAGAIVAPAAEGMYALSAPAMGGAGLGLTASTTAPLGASIGSSLGTAGAAAEGAALASAGAGASAGALGAGGAAMMGALASNPVGWAIGAGLLAKKLKLF